MKETRRELFIRASRHLTLTVLGAFGVSTYTKRRRLLREGRCINAGICPDCSVFKNCGLPRALSVREALVRKENVGK